MSAASGVVSEATMVVLNPTATAATKIMDESAVESEVESAGCECCGFTEECTQAYIRSIRGRYQGKWICGLCAEAVTHEMMRMRMRDEREEQALARHMSLCSNFIKSKSASPPPNPAVHLISAMRTSILRRRRSSPLHASSSSSSTSLMPNSPPSSGTRGRGRGLGLRQAGSTHHVVPSVSPIHHDCVENI